MGYANLAASLARVVLHLALASRQRRIDHRMASPDDSAGEESVRVVVSDPWEFGDAYGTRPLAARVLRRMPFGASRAMVILLDEPIDFGGLRYEYVLATPRPGLRHGPNPRGSNIPD